MKNILFSARNRAIFGLFLCASLMCGFSFAQVNVTPAPFVKSQYFNASVPCNACQLFTYAAGTTTPLVSYTDSTGVTPNADPVVLDANGYASVWLGPSVYKLVLKTSGGATIWTVDGVSGWYANFLSLNGGNAFTAISDPAASLGKFWLSTTNAGRIKWSDASAIHTIVGVDTTDNETNKTLTSAALVAPVITGAATAAQLSINGGTAITAQSGTGGTVAMTASPTFTGTVTVAALTASGLITANLGATVSGAALITTRIDYPRQAVTLVNGANSDIALNGASFIKISGPTGAFSISGFVGGEDGRVLEVFNGTSQAMTITNNATSSAGNRISTLTGADVVLAARTSFACFTYDSASTFWILKSTN